MASKDAAAKQKGEDFPEGVEVVAEMEKVADPSFPPFKKVLSF